MFMNLHALEAGTAMFTIYIADGVEVVEEIDLVLDERMSADEIREHALKELEDEYIPNLTIAGIVNQSDGYIVADWREDLNLNGAARA